MAAYGSLHPLILPPPPPLSPIPRILHMYMPGHYHTAALGTQPSVERTGPAKLAAINSSSHGPLKHKYRKRRVENGGLLYIILHRMI
jgi:hypothetical protein